jgi:hypothetical protein
VDYINVKDVIIQICTWYPVLHVTTPRTAASRGPPTNTSPLPSSLTRRLARRPRQGRGNSLQRAVDPVARPQ